MFFPGFRTLALILYIDFSTILYLFCLSSVSFLCIYFICVLFIVLCQFVSVGCVVSVIDHLALNQYINKQERNFIIIIIIIIIIIVVVSCHRPFLPGTSLEPAVIPTAQASSFTLQYSPYYVWCSKYSCLL